MLVIKNDSVGCKKLSEFISRERVTPIFDIDGVIADASHRISLNADGSLNLEHYRANTTAKNVNKDKLLPLAKVVAICNVSGIGYAVATARALCNHSHAWLDSHNIRPFLTWSRNGEHDKRKDYKLKGDHFSADIPNYLRSLYCLIDDNLDNCKEAERLGMKVVHVKSTVLA